MDMATWGFGSGSVVLVTGAASGIGAATALGARRPGTRGRLGHRPDRPRRGHGRDHHGGTVRTAVVDIFDDAAIDAGFTEVEQVWAPVRHLVNKYRPALRSTRTPSSAAINLAVCGEHGGDDPAVPTHHAHPNASVVNVSSVHGELHGLEPAVVPHRQGRDRRAPRALAWKSRGHRHGSTPWRPLSSRRHA